MTTQTEVRQAPLSDEALQLLGRWWRTANYCRWGGSTRSRGLPADRRHGLFNYYEAFIHIVDSMFNQHAKWLKVTRQTPWRRPIPSLSYLRSIHVWRQDHNGFAFQDPGLVRDPDGD